MDREAIDVTAPTVPSDDQRADELAIGFGNEKRVWIVFEKGLRLSALPCATGWASGPPPEAYHCVEIVQAGASDGNHGASLVQDVAGRPI